jgi:hypothetical protein
LEAPMTATELGANKCCQLMCLLCMVSLELSKFSHLDFTRYICYKQV